jgi:hypothetical protein
MTNRSKILILLSLGIGFVAIALLSTGLSDLELKPGKRFSLVESESKDREEASGSLHDRIITSILPAMFLAWAVLLVSSLYYLFTREGRKRAIKLVITLIVLYGLMRLLISKKEFARNLDISLPGMGQFPSDVAPVEFIPNSPQWLIITIGAGGARETAGGGGPVQYGDPLLRRDEPGLQRAAGGSPRESHYPPGIRAPPGGGGSSGRPRSTAYPAV